MARGAVKAQDFRAANSLWEKNFSDEDALFGRLFQRLDATMNGLDKGAAELAQEGIRVPFFREVRPMYTKLRNNYREFFDYRQQELRKFFAARLEGKEYARNWDALQQDLSARYKKLILDEDAMMGQIDNAFSRQTDDPATQAAYVRSREVARQMRLEDKTELENFRATLEGLSAEERSPAWDVFVAEKIG